MNTVPARRAVAAGASALALSTLTACGTISDFMPGQDPFLDQSARSMAKASFADMQDVGSMRILGDLDSDEFGRMRVDISVGKDGCNGSFELDGKGGFQLRHNDDGTWLRADERFWQTQMDTRAQGDQAWRTIRNRWLVVDDKDEKDDYRELCDLDRVLAEFELDPEDTEDSLEAGAVAEVGDSDAVPLTGGKGSKRTTMWVSLDAPHHVLKMAPAKDKGLPDALYFEEFGVKVVVETPGKKEIFKAQTGQLPI